MKIGLNIKREMQAKRLNIKELSSKCNIGAGNLCEIISGKRNNPRIKTLIKIAKGLEVSIEKLIKGIDENE